MIKCVTNAYQLLFIRGKNAYMWQICVQSQLKSDSRMNVCGLDSVWQYEDVKYRQFTASRWCLFQNKIIAAKPICRQTVFPQPGHFPYKADVWLLLALLFLLWSNRVKKELL